MKRDEMLHGRFIKAGEFKGKAVTLTVAALEQEMFEKDNGTEESKWTVAFREKRKSGEPLEWVLNRTNIELLFAMWEDTEEWIGKRVTLFPERDTSGKSESGFCIRVKGSPDIAGPITTIIKLPRKKPVERKLLKTVAGADTHPDADTEPAAPRTDYRNMEMPAGLLDDDEPAGGFDDLS